MTIDDGVILPTVGLILVILLVLAIAMFYAASIWPNNTALYLSVLGGLATIVAIISLIVILADACKDGNTEMPYTRFFVWCILAALSMSFAIASAMVVATEEMANNPYCIWNWGEQS